MDDEEEETRWGLVIINGLVFGFLLVAFICGILSVVLE